MNPDWKELAACKGRHPSMFFSLQPEVVAEAKRLCAICPVTEECLAAGRYEYGLWGGRTLDERSGSSKREVNMTPKSCDFCGETFTPHGGGCQFCPNCQMRTSRKTSRRTRAPITERVCANALCSNVYMPRRRSHVCCSDRCAAIYRGQQRDGCWDYGSADKRRMAALRAQVEAETS